MLSFTKLNNDMKSFKKILSDHKISVTDISLMFNYKTPNSFSSSKIRGEMESGLEQFYDRTRPKK